jgi:hypothetical protein
MKSHVQLHDFCLRSIFSPKMRIFLLSTSATEPQSLFCWIFSYLLLSFSVTQAVMFRLKKVKTDAPAATFKSMG